MKVKIVLLLIFLVAFSRISYSQFSTKTEFDYLKLINFQQDKKLIKSSLKNATIVANNLILEKNSKINTLFYNEFSKSQYLAKNYDKSIYYQLLQRVLFSNDSIANNSKNRFYDAAFKANFSKNEIDYFWTNTIKSKLPNTKNKKILLCLELGTKLFSKNVTTPIFRLAQVLKKQEFKMPQWYKDWEYLTTIGIKEKHKEYYLDYDTNTSLFDRLATKKRLKLYNKSINYYIKKHAFKQSKDLIKIYKKEDVSSLKKNSSLFFKRIAMLYHKII